MISLKSTATNGFLYDHVVGTGGIGSGMFFILEGNHNLGRNESRMATLLPSIDFCKLHIIMHYMAVFLGAKNRDGFQLFAVSRVGNDVTGRNLVRQMEDVGINTVNIAVSETGHTLFSVCFQYPDHSGGNITVANSASSEVSATDISRFFSEFAMPGSREVILAVPEVPLPARISILQYGRERGSLNVASVLSSEVNEWMHANGVELVDLLFINIDEAGSIAGMKDDAIPSQTVADACINKLLPLNPLIRVLITDGSNGCYCWEKDQLTMVPALQVPVCSTAGAGDAFLAGTVTGLICGLPLTKGISDSYFSETPLQSAVELGTLIASLSVTSFNTIHLEADTELLVSFCEKNNVKFGDGFIDLFKQGP